MDLFRDVVNGHSFLSDCAWSRTEHLDVFTDELQAVPGPTGERAPCRGTSVVKESPKQILIPTQLF